MYVNLFNIVIKTSPKLGDKPRMSASQVAQLYKLLFYAKLEHVLWQPSLKMTMLQKKMYCLGYLTLPRSNKLSDNIFSIKSQEINLINIYHLFHENGFSIYLCTVGWIDSVFQTSVH